MSEHRRMNDGDRVWAKLDHRDVRQPWQRMFFRAEDTCSGFVVVSYRTFGGRSYVAREQDVVPREPGDHLGPKDRVSVTTSGTTASKQRSGA